MALELGPLVSVEGAESVRGREGVEGFVIPGLVFTTSRSRSSPSRMRVFTVPSGCLILSAISVWVSPA
jgi:hypothetical protein